MGGAAGHGDGHIGRHTHRQHIRRHAFCLQLRQQLLHLPELRAQSRFAGGGFGHTHQPAHLHARQRGHGASQSHCFFRRHAVFVRLGGNIHFDANLQRRHIIRTLIAQALRRFQALDGVHPMRAFGHLPGFIGLHLADNMPHNIGAIGQLIGLGRPFLNIVFTEIALAGGIHCADIGGGKRFAHRHQRHAAGGAAGSGFGRRDGGFNLLVIVLQDIHFSPFIAAV